MRRLFVASVAFAIVTLPMVAVQGTPVAQSAIAKAVADPRRPASERANDANRKPAETLAFAGVRPGMTVGEFYPGDGYFTRMLSDVVGPTGHVYGLDNKGWGNATSLAAALSAGRYT
ncbi:MAG: methyltransferase, partial [Sphingomonas sp.]